jgi:hypothetical protein
LRRRRPFGLAFAPAPAGPALASPPDGTRWLILQKARRHPRGAHPKAGRLRLRPARSAGFQVSFTPLAGVLFTVPSRYWFTIGRWRYLALGRGRPRFPPDVACRAVLTQRSTVVPRDPPYGALTPSGGPFQWPSGATGAVREAAAATSLRPFNPQTASPAGCAAARVWAPPRSLAATRGILSSPRGTEMFQFPRCPPGRVAPPGAPPCAARVAPFGDPRLTGCQHLPGAFRRVATSFLGRQRQGIHPALIFATLAPAPALHQHQDRRSQLTRSPAARACPAGSTAHAHRLTLTSHARDRRCSQTHGARSCARTSTQCLPRPPRRGLHVVAC